MGKTKYTRKNVQVQRNPIFKKVNANRSKRITRPRTKTRQSRSSPFEFQFAEDKYYFHVPKNYINRDFPEDANIKFLFLTEQGTGIKIKKITSEQLNGLCKEYAGLTQNLKMQMSSNIVLYVENLGTIKAAATIGLGYDQDDFADFDFENENEEEETEKEWNISQIRILTLCSKEAGYGKKLMNQLKTITMVGNDNGYITDDVELVLNSTLTSEPFYVKQGFICVNNECILKPLM